MDNEDIREIAYGIIGLLDEVEERDGRVEELKGVLELVRHRVSQGGIIDNSANKIKAVIDDAL